VSKLAKFRNSPAQFFADSRHGAVRAAGRVLVPTVFRREPVMSFLEEPVEALSASRAPVVAPAAAHYRRWERRRRLASLRAAGHPTVSVIVAARNAEEWIGRSIESLLSQSYPASEILVVDDASNDGTPRRVAELAAHAPVVRLVQRAHQGGAAAARNTGLAAATGDYVTFQDADDVSHPERIERQLAALLREPGAVLCVCNYRRERPDGTRVLVNGRRFGKNVISMLFPRDPVLTRVGFMLDIRIGEDTEYYERIRAVFGRAREVHLFQTLYRARFSTDSLLFSSGDTTLDSSDRVTYVRSEEAERDYQDMLARLARIRDRSLDPYVPFTP
jgi:glycosyltransferase involved in cell wall biosynthesis